MTKINKKIKFYFWNFFVNVIASSVIFPKSLRWRLYSIFGIKITKANIKSGCFFRNSNTLIGKDVFINNNCFIESNALVTIGDRVSIAMNVTIGSDTHKIGISNRRAGDVISLPITIGNGTWIGANSTILAGVNIGEGCIIAAGSVVTMDCKPNGLYAGVPAVRKKDFEIGV
jgi:maltose O-acetyltransferase